MQSVVRHCVAKVNKRFMQWNLLKAVFCGDVQQQSNYFRPVAIVTKNAIDNGKPFFTADYKDPDFHTSCFGEFHGEDEQECHSLTSCQRYLPYKKIVYWNP